MYFLRNKMNFRNSSGERKTFLDIKQYTYFTVNPPNKMPKLTPMLLNAINIIHVICYFFNIYTYVYVIFFLINMDSFLLYSFISIPGGCMSTYSVARVLLTF